MSKKISIEEVAKHQSDSDCWIIVHGKVYDVTGFLNDHPGGKKVLLKAAGTDASKQFDAFHNASVLAKYGPNFLIGEVGVEEESETNQKGPLTVNDTYGDMVPFGDPMWYQDWYR